jgi:drug/metabolite transporter (DMT)-like permease
MHEDPRAVTRAVLRLLVGAVMISFAPVFVRLVELPATVIGFYRCFVGGAVLLGWVLVRRMPLRVGRPALLALALGGAAFAADLSMWHRSVWYVGPGLSTLLANFQVFVLALVGVLFFGERVHLRLVMSIVMAVVGLGLIVGLRWDLLDEQYRLGVILGLLAAGAYATYILCLRWASTRAPAAGAARGTPPARAPVRELALASLIAAGCLGAGALVGGESLIVTSLRDGGLLVGYALVAQVLGWVLISSALGHVPASRVGLILLLQPALAFVWDVLLFARPVTVRESAGATLALVGIYFGSRLGPRLAPGPATAPPRAE